MRTIRTLVVDDEPIARDIIKSHLDRVPNWEIVASCSNTQEAFDSLLQNSIDLIFLDIQMPNQTGIEFLNTLKNPPLVILTTAFGSHALKGFELNVVDYLLKPIVFSRFYQAIEKANERLVILNSSILRTYHFFKVSGELKKVNFKNIVYIKAEQEYSYIYTDTSQILVSMHLKRIQELLPDEEFIRIHRSYIVSIEKVVSISGNQVYMNDTTKLPVSKTNKPHLLKSLQID